MSSSRWGLAAYTLSYLEGNLPDKYGRAMSKSWEKHVEQDAVRFHRSFVLPDWNHVCKLSQVLVLGLS